MVIAASSGLFPVHTQEESIRVLGSYQGVDRIRPCSRLHVPLSPQGIHRAAGSRSDDRAPGPPAENSRQAANWHLGAIKMGAIGRSVVPRLLRQQSTPSSQSRARCTEILLLSCPSYQKGVWECYSCRGSCPNRAAPSRRKRDLSGVCSQTSSRHQREGDARCACSPYISVRPNKSKDTSFSDNLRALPEIHTLSSSQFYMGCRTLIRVAFTALY